MPRSIWRLSVTPKWIGGLLIALAVASIFAWLGQWQLGRAIESNQPIQIVKTQTIPVMIDNKNVFIVTDRIQNGTSGYWLISNSITESGQSVILALGWTEKLADAERVRNDIKSSMLAQAFLPVTGETLPTEPPVSAKNEYTFRSVSTAQLANVIAGTKSMRADYLAVNTSATPSGLETIHAEISQEAGINWLSAFYAVEWAVFAGFAVFMWWRLLKDAHIAEGLN